MGRRKMNLAASTDTSSGVMSGVEYRGGHIARVRKVVVDARIIVKTVRQTYLHTPHLLASERTANPDAFRDTDSTRTLPYTMRALHMRDMHVRVLHTCETRTLTSHTFPTQFRLPLARSRPPLPYTCEPRRPISHTFAIAGLDSCQYTSSPITCFNVFHHAQAHFCLHVVCLHVPPPAACSLLCEPYLCAPMAHAV